jgi:MFS family permease
MLDITLFRNIRFSAASFSITVAFFGLFGFIFLITQYFQLVHGYSPLSAGVRTLPFALGVGAAAPAAPILARRLGTKIVVPAGLILMAAGFFVASTLGSDSAYFGPVLVSMVLMAVGLGLVTAPSTGAILAVLPLGKAGVGSAVNDVTRELGGTLGVAVVGAVFSSVYGPRLAQLLHGTGVPAPALAAARQSPAAALQVAGRAPASAHAAIIDAANRAFVAGLSRGSLVCACAVALGAVFAFLVLPRRLPGTPPGPPTAPGSKPGQVSSAKSGSHEIRQADRPAAEGSPCSDERRHASAPATRSAPDDAAGPLPGQAERSPMTVLSGGVDHADAALDDT